MASSGMESRAAFHAFWLVFGMGYLEVVLFEHVHIFVVVSQCILVQRDQHKKMFCNHFVDIVDDEVINNHCELVDCAWCFVFL